MSPMNTVLVFSISFVLFSGGLYATAKFVPRNMEYLHTLCIKGFSQLPIIIPDFNENGTAKACTQ